MDEAQGNAAGLGEEVGGRHRAGIALDGAAALRADPMPGAIGLETLLHAGVGPGEDVQRQGDLALLERMGERDEEAALEGADLGDRALQAFLGLQAQQPRGDRRGEARGHADNAIIAVGEIGLDRVVAGEGKGGSGELIHRATVTMRQRPVTPPMRAPLSLGVEDEEGAGRDQRETDGVVPGQALLEPEHREAGEDGQGNDLLHRLELGGRIDGGADAVGRHRQDVFRQRDHPAREDREPDGRALVAEMAIPGEGHEDVGADQHGDRQDMRGGDGGHRTRSCGEAGNARRSGLFRRSCQLSRSEASSRG